MRSTIRAFWMSCLELSSAAMPTYEFRCESGHAIDRFFRSMASAPAVIECPECGASAVRQVSGGIGLVFKGSGFYITDYGKDGKKPQPTGPEGPGKGESAGDIASSPKPDAAAPASGASSGSSGSSDSSGSKSESGTAGAKPDAGSPPKKSSSE
ncbi:MAG TPA: FmdB family zinc ribbon protein [Gemmatimonadaceae bacterium]|nr:FmdB family zinc ribbon protein [Gemmatimonadaceae bacterium]